MPNCKGATSSGSVPREFSSDPTPAEEAQWANQVINTSTAPSCFDPSCQERTTYEIYKLKRADGSVHALLCYARWCESPPRGRETGGEKCEPAAWQSAVVDKFVPAAEWEDEFVEEFDDLRRRAWMACLTPCRAVWQSFYMDTEGQAGPSGTRRVLIMGYWRCERPR
jgi:hypothetical protein